MFSCLDGFACDKIANFLERTVTLETVEIGKLVLFVSTRGIRWILWFSVRYTTAAAHREIFGVNALRGKMTPARFTKFARYLHWEVSFSETEITLILKNKMAATSISLKIIYVFLLPGSHN